MNFESWLTTTIGTGGVLALIIFLSKNTILDWLANSIKHKYDVDLETHKANLKRDYDVQIERLKAQLQVANVRFSHVFIKTEEVIAQTYAMIWELKEIAEGIHDTKILERDDRFNRFLEKGGEFKKYFEPNVIYVRFETANKIRTTYNSLQESALKWNEALNTSADDLPARKAAFEKYFIVRKDIPDLLELLKIDFQDILGFTIDEKKK